MAMGVCVSPSSSPLYGYGVCVSPSSSPLVAKAQAPHHLQTAILDTQAAQEKKSKEVAMKVHKVKRKDGYQEASGSSRGSLCSLEQGIPIEELVLLLQKHAKEKNRDQALHVHVQVSKYGLNFSGITGNLLVKMLVDVGQLSYAHQVFNALTEPTDSSYNSLILGYIKHGDSLQALSFYRLILSDTSLNLYMHTFMALLKACAKFHDMEVGQAIHKTIASKGWLGSDPFFGSALVHMYSKCGLLAKAQEVFDLLQVRDVVLWNALIMGYTEHGGGGEALDCFDGMQQEGVLPTHVSYIGSLKACGCIQAAEKGRILHAEIVKKGCFERDLVVGSTLVDMYAKCGWLEEAKDVFDKLTVQDTVSWSALMAGYVEHGHGYDALVCFEQMQLEGVPLDILAFACSLKACASIGDLKRGQKIDHLIAKKGLSKDPLIGTSLVDMYARFGTLEKAREVFNQLPARALGSWNALISGYVENGHEKEALECYDGLQSEGMCGDVTTFACILKACGAVKAMEKGKEIHALIAKEGLEGYDIVGNTLVDMYGKFGLVAEAQEAFDMLFVRNIVSWNALISGYAEDGHTEEALNCLKQMQSEGCSPDATTFVCSLKVCGNIGVIEKGQELNVEVVQKGFEGNLLVGGTLVYMYAKCGLLAEAEDVFDRLPVRHTVAWNALIAGYSQAGRSEEVLATFDNMKGEGERPDLVTFLSILHACSHAGLVDLAHTYFEAMSEEYGLTPSLEHHTCMLDLLGRVGQLAKALSLLKKMPDQPDIALWSNLLGTCQKWGDVEVARQAFDQLVHLDKSDASAYACMCNIYAKAGMLENAAEVAAMQPWIRAKG